MFTVNVGITEVEGGYEWESVTLPNGRWGRSLIINALVEAHYPADKVQAIINNFLGDMFNAGYLSEYRALQEWRDTAKLYASIAMACAEEHEIGQEELEPEDVPNVPTEVELRPDGMTMLQQAVMMLKGQALELPDEKAAEVPALFPTWEEMIGKQVEAGKRLFYAGRLWKVLQAHTVQEYWTPLVAASLFTEVVAEGGGGDAELGTLENPIPYNNNMELEEGKYYSQDGVTYLCIRSTGVPVYNNLADLVHIYVEVAP